MLNITISSLFAGLLFSSIGLWMIREGRHKADNRIVVIGVLLMGYSYFTPNPFFDWGVGIALCLTAYNIWN